jgi:hypothetical protein
MTICIRTFSFPPVKKAGLKIQDTEEGWKRKSDRSRRGVCAEKAGLQKDDVITKIAA